MCIIIFFAVFVSKQTFIILLQFSSSCTLSIEISWGAIFTTTKKHLPQPSPKRNNIQHFAMWETVKQYRIALLPITCRKYDTRPSLSHTQTQSSEPPYESSTSACNQTGFSLTETSTCGLKPRGWRGDNSTYKS